MVAVVLYLQRPFHGGIGIKERRRTTGYVDTAVAAVVVATVLDLEIRAAVVREPTWGIVEPILLEAVFSKRDPKACKFTQEFQKRALKSFIGGTFESCGISRMRSTKGQSSIEELGQFQKFRLAGKRQDHYVWGKPFDLVCSHLGIASRYKNRTR